VSRPGNIDEMPPGLLEVQLFVVLTFAQESIDRTRIRLSGAWRVDDSFFATLLVSRSSKGEEELDTSMVIR
jgi:hypothetical protein